MRSENRKSWRLCGRVKYGRSGVGGIRRGQVALSAADVKVYFFY